MSDSRPLQGGLTRGDVLKIRSLLACLVASAAVITTTSLPAQAAGPEAISKCSDNTGYGFGTTVDHDSYLTRDLTCQKGFVIVNGATLDMRGHTLRGKDDPYSCVGQGCPDNGIHFQPGHAGIILAKGTLKNGRLDNWDYAVRIHPDDGGSDRLITHMTITNSRFRGVFSFENSDTATISWSLFTRTSGGVGSQFGGGYAIDHTAFVRWGVQMTYAQAPLTITNSVFTDTGAGSIYGQGPVTLKRNVFYNSPGDGTNVSQNNAAVSVGGNVAYQNAGHGMVFKDNPGGVVDLGGNRASGNKIEPQCIGVVCR